MSALMRAGGSAAMQGARRSRAVGYTPDEEASLIEGFDISFFADTAAGAKASWTGLRGTVATLSGTTHDYSPTLIVDDEGGTHPGMDFLATLMTCPLGALIAGKTRPALVIAMQNTQHALCVIAELGPVYNSDGRFALLGNVIGGGGGDDFYAVAQGGGGKGSWQLPARSVPYDPCSIAAVFDFSSAPVGSTAWRIDNVNVLDGVVGGDGAALVAGSTAENATFYFGARFGTAFPWKGGLAGWWLLDNPDEAALTRVSQYASQKVGQVAA